MFNGTSKYRAKKYSLGTIGLLGMASVPLTGPIGLIVGGVCALAGLKVMEKEDADVDAHLYDTKRFYEKTKKEELRFYSKLKTIEDKIENGGIKIE